MFKLYERESLFNFQFGFLLFFLSIPIIVLFVGLYPLIILKNISLIQYFWQLESILLASLVFSHICLRDLSTKILITDKHLIYMSILRNAVIKYEDIREIVDYVQGANWRYHIIVANKKKYFIPEIIHDYKNLVKLIKSKSPHAHCYFAKKFGAIE